MIPDDIANIFLTGSIIQISIASLYFTRTTNRDKKLTTPTRNNIMCGAKNDKAYFTNHDIDVVVF